MIDVRNTGRRRCCPSPTENEQAAWPVRQKVAREKCGLLQRNLLQTATRSRPTFCAHRKHLLGTPIEYRNTANSDLTSNMTPDTLPPYRHVSSRPISLADASKMLDKYVADSEKHAHLQPDSLITPTGVAFSSNGGPKGGVVMHNLRRVAAGLRGEYLEPEKTPEPEEEEPDLGITTLNGNMNGQTADKEQGDWQEMSEFEREEGMIEVGELGDRTNVVAEGGEVPEIEAAGAKQDGAKRKKGGDEAGLDKEARKKAKKDRLKKEQKEREKAKANKSK
jgi:hypothetical protein